MILEFPPRHVRRVRDRDLSEFNVRLPRRIAFTIMLALSGGLWALIWVLVKFLL